MIPIDWEETLVEDLVNNSIIEKPLDGNHGNIHPTAEDFVSEGIPFIMANSIYNGFLDLSVCNFIRKDQADKLQKGFSIKGDILLTHKGSVGNVAIVERINTDYIMLTPQVTYYRILKHDKLERTYLKAFFESEGFQNLLKIRSGGGTRAYIGITNQRQLPILLPPLHEQKAIAQVLSTVDAAIHTTEKLIAQKELRKKWLMQQLLLGKKRLKAFGGEWNEHSYEKILKVVKRNFDWDENELYKLISVRRRSGGIFYREALYGHQILVKTLRTANKGDFLFSKMQILHGASALVTKEFDGAKISGSYIAVVPKDKKQLNMEFFQWYSQTPYFYHQTYISSYGVHIEKMTFDFDTFLQLEMKLPSFEEQIAITQVLQSADKEIKLLKSKTEKLREQKKGMMQMLLTGKKRFKINE